MGAWSLCADNQVVTNVAIEDAISNAVFDYKAGQGPPYVLPDYITGETKDAIISCPAIVDQNFPPFYWKANNQLIIKSDLIKPGQGNYYNVYVHVIPGSESSISGTNPNATIQATIEFSAVVKLDSFTFTLTVYGNNSNNSVSVSASGFSGRSSNIITINVGNNTSVSDVILTAISPILANYQNFIPYSGPQATSVNQLTLNNTQLTVDHFNNEIASSQIQASENVDASLTINMSTTTYRSDTKTNSTVTGSCTIGNGNNFIQYSVIVGPTGPTYTIIDMHIVSVSSSSSLQSYDYSSAVYP